MLYHVDDLDMHQANTVSCCSKLGTPCNSASPFRSLLKALPRLLQSRAQAKQELEEVQGSSQQAMVTRVGCACNCLATEYPLEYLSERCSSTVKSICSIKLLTLAIVPSQLGVPYKSNTFLDREKIH